MSKIRTSLWVLLVGLIAIFIQGSVLKSILPDFLVPNFLISIVVFLAFYENSPFGALLVFILGIQFDLYLGHPLLVGPSAGSFVAVYGLLSSLSQRLFVESGFAIFFVTLFSAILNSMVHAVLVFEFNSSAVRFLSSSLITAFITALVTPFMFRFLGTFLRRNVGQAKLTRSRSVNA